MKSYTDLNQSKKLAEILPIESADMYWWYSGRRYYIEAIDDGDFNEKGDIRAWSLASLLDYIKDKCSYFELVYISNTLEGEVNELGMFYRLSTDACDVCEEEAVDACVEMIVKLHELNIV